MGQKVNPVGMRVGINREWESRWYASKKDYATFLIEDIKIREYVEENLKDALVSATDVERSKDTVLVMIKVARPGVVIGQDNKRINEISKQIAKICGGKKVNVTIVEVKNPDLDATLIAKQMAEQLEARASFRTVQKKAIQRVMKAGAKGIKTEVSGRLGGADMARTEFYSEGTIPLQTLRADIDYGFAEADTTYGKMGIKVWIYAGEVLPVKNNQEGGAK